MLLKVLIIKINRFLHFIHSYTYIDIYYLYYCIYAFGFSGSLPIFSNNVKPILK